MGMFDWIEWEGNQYQTKDTPNQMCDNYRISGCGELFVEEYDAEWVRDESNTLFGMRLDTSNHRWRECVEFSGKIRFYRENKESRGWDNEAWIEWEAEFKSGLMIGLNLIEGEPLTEWYMKGLEEKGLK
jgi:hypothetical protein